MHEVRDDLMENKKISVIFFGIGLLFVMLYFIIPIQHSGSWLIYSYCLIISPLSVTFFIDGFKLDITM